MVIKGVLPMPHAQYSHEDVLDIEKEAFEGFFIFLDKYYRLEKEIEGCLAYRLVNKDVE